MINKKNIILLVVIMFISMIYALQTIQLQNYKRNNFILKKQLKIKSQKLENINEIEIKIKKLKNSLSQNRIKNLSASIYFVSNEYGLDADFLIALGFAESSFDKYALSEAKCKGYYQINDKVHNVDKEQLYQEYYQTVMAANIYKGYYNQYKTQQKALNAYNGKLYNNDYHLYVINIMNKVKTI